MISGIRAVTRSAPSLLVSRASPHITRSVTRANGAFSPAANGPRNLAEASQLQYRWFSDGKKEEAEEKKEEASAEEPSAEETVQEENKEEALQVEVQTLKDQLLRSLAEQENTRTIAKKDVEAARNFAIKSFAKSLLEVSDNLHRALQSVDDDELTTNQPLASLYEGIQMTNDGLLKAFQSNGVVKYCDEPGEAFDPEMMNALMEYPDPSKEPGTVGQIIKAGFTLNSRVLRPAEVGVVKKT